MAKDFGSVSSLVNIFQPSVQFSPMLYAREFLFPFTFLPVNQGRCLLLSQLGTLTSR